MKEKLKKSLEAWIPSALILTLVFFFGGMAISQVYRTSADDPQVQYVEEIGNYLSTKDSDPKNVTGDQKIDPAKSLSPFVIIFNNDRKTVTSSADFEGGTPIPASSKFSKINKSYLFGLLKNEGQVRFSWGLNSKVRVAAVLSSYQVEGKDAGYILVGRSLKEVDGRILYSIVTLAIGWLISCLVTFLYFLLPSLNLKAPKLKTQIKK
jgi:hypothetical protein